MKYIPTIIGAAALATFLGACAAKQEQVRVYEPPADRSELPAWLQSNGKTYGNNGQSFVYGTLDLSNNNRYGQEIVRFLNEQGPNSDRAVALLRDAAAVHIGALEVTTGAKKGTYSLTGEGYNGNDPSHQAAYDTLTAVADANGDQVVSDNEARVLLEAILDQECVKPK